MGTMVELGLNSDEFASVAEPVMLTVPNSRIGDIWPQVAPLFLVFESLEPVYYSRSDMFKLLTQGLMQLHLAHDGEKFHFGVITEIVEYPRTRVCRMLLGSGERPDLALEFYDVLADWAKARDVEWIELIGRLGWERVLRPLNFYKTSTVMYKRV